MTVLYEMKRCARDDCRRDFDALTEPYVQLPTGRVWCQDCFKGRGQEPKVIGPRLYFGSEAPVPPREGGRS